MPGSLSYSTVSVSPELIGTNRSIDFSPAYPKVHAVPYSCTAPFKNTVIFGNTSALLPVGEKYPKATFSAVLTLDQETLCLVKNITKAKKVSTLLLLTDVSSPLNRVEDFLQTSTNTSSSNAVKLVGKT